MAASRIFFALWPQADIRRQLYHCAGELLPDKVRRVAEHNLHLTLVFIGQVTDEQRVCYQQIAGQISAKSFELEIDSTLSFARARVCCLGATSTVPGLQALLKQLQQATADCGYQPQTRPFVPHVTIARPCRSLNAGKLATSIHWPVTSFSLLQSCSTPQGVLYRELQQWPLLSNTSQVLT